MVDFIFNPLTCKSPAGTCKTKTSVTYSIKVSKFIGFDSALFVVHKDGFAPEVFEMTRTFTDEKYIYLSFTKTYLEPGHYWYHFEIKTKDDYIYLVKSDTLDCVNSKADSDYLQLVIEKNSKVDESFKKGIIYHIFVDRFNSSGKVKPRKGLNLIDKWDKPISLEYDLKGERCNFNCYGGNLQGIIDKLDYLKKLNVSIIYLSPIFEANSSHKYDTANYEKIDSMFGDKKTLQKLILEAKGKGISIILDGVFNHTGSDSIYFNRFKRYKTLGAYESKKSPFYSWYDFIEYPDLYSSWWGVKSLPQTREDSGFFDYISGKSGIIETFMSLGLGGFRLDVADELSNKFLSAINARIKKINPKGIVVGEVWEDASSKISYGERKNYFLGNSLDSVTNYPMKNAILDFVKSGNVHNFICTINMIKDQYPREIQNNLMNILDTHDTVRAITFLGKNDNSILEEDGSYKLTKEEKIIGKSLLKIAALMQYTVVGMPTVFYGDEAGIEGMKDPFCRATYPWGKEDKELISYYELLGKIRNEKVFSSGEMNILYAENGVLIYERKIEKHRAIVAINRSTNNFEFNFEGRLKDYFTNKVVTGEYILKPMGTLLLL